VNQRREKIEAMLQAEPHDIFLRYALAMEMEKAGETLAALDLHAQLTTEQPPHVASFFRAAQIYHSIQETESARSALRFGIQAARDAGDLHAAAEMGEMLTDLGRLGE
jgi:thioredoxin-like negative regulator of GroEL